MSRAPIGFVVEGDAEFRCYPSLVCRLVAGTGFNVPRVNAGGYGNIARHLAAQLQALVLAHHPCHVIVTLDLKDVVDAGLYPGCAELRADLEAQATEWLVNAQANPRVHPLPERIVAVVQVQQFESWMIADIGGLMQSGYLAASEPQFTNVDEQVPNPCSWLRARMPPGANPKSPPCARAIVGCLDPATIRRNSPSFDKFCREVLSAYGSWCDLCGML